MSAPNALLARLDEFDAGACAGWEPRPLPPARCDLAATFTALPMPGPADRRRFEARGVSPFALLGWRVCPRAIGEAVYRRTFPGDAPVDAPFSVRRGRVQFLPRRRFVFADDRRAEPDAVVPAFVIPAVEDGQIVDLVAWEPAAGLVASLERRAGWLAGPEPTPDEPLVVYPDPMAWLAACRAGVVVVHEGLARPFLLAQPAVQAADIAHGEALRAMLAKVRLPRIVVPVSSLGLEAA